MTCEARLQEGLGETEPVEPRRKSLLMSRVVAMQGQSAGAVAEIEVVCCMLAAIIMSFEGSNGKISLGYSFTIPLT